MAVIGSIARLVRRVLEEAALAEEIYSSCALVDSLTASHIEATGWPYANVRDIPRPDPADGAVYAVGLGHDEAGDILLWKCFWWLPHAPDLLYTVDWSGLTVE